MATRTHSTTPSKSPARRSSSRDTHTQQSLQSETEFRAEVERGLKQSLAEFSSPSSSPSARFAGKSKGQGQGKDPSDNPRLSSTLSLDQHVDIFSKSSLSVIRSAQVSALLEASRQHSGGKGGELAKPGESVMPGDDSTVEVGSSSAHSQISESPVSADSIDDSVLVLAVEKTDSMNIKSPLNIKSQLNSSAHDASSVDSSGN